MSKPIKSKIALLSILVVAYCIMLSVIPVHADTNGTEGRVIEEPEVLVIQLGKAWAGVEFELVTDSGKYPGTVVVSETGLLTMDLGGSSTYTLSALNSSVSIPEPETDSETDSETENSDQDQQIPATNTSEDTIADTGDETSDTTGADENTGEETSDSGKTSKTVLGIPVMHLILFVGGLVLCIAILIALKIVKSKRLEYDDDDEYED